MNEISTIGLTLKWCVSSGSTRPVNGFTKLNGLKSLPATGDAPNNLQVTDLDDSFHRYIPGVQDSGGAKSFTFNDTADNRTGWNAMVTAYEGRGAGEVLWIEETFTGTGMDSFYYTGIPSDWTVNDRGVDEVVEATGYITVNKVIGFAQAST